MQSLEYRVRIPNPLPPRRSAPFDQEPGFYEPAGLWMYGNVRLLGAKLAHIQMALALRSPSPKEFEAIEREAEQLVLGGSVLVSGVHNPAHQQAAIVPLRWGAPRILVLSGGFEHHLGPNLKEEPFRTARLWRYEFDATTDLVISRRAPTKPPTFALHNPTVDRLIGRLVKSELPGLLFERGPLHH